jgi:hypothetical protein
VPTRPEATPVAVAPRPTPAPASPRPAEGRPRRWRRRVLAGVAAVCLLGAGLAVRPLLDQVTADEPADAARTTTAAPTTAPPTTAPPDTAGTGGGSKDATGDGPSSAAVHAAIATIAAKGYTAEPDERRLGDTLSVFIAIATDSATSYNQKAFFFVGTQLRYIGTDTLNASRGISVDWNTSDTIALEYDLYQPDDANCCPTGGTTVVRYHWNGTKLVPLDDIPADSGEAALTR